MHTAALDDKVCRQPCCGVGAFACGLTRLRSLPGSDARVQGRVGEAGRPRASAGRAVGEGARRPSIRGLVCPVRLRASRRRMVEPLRNCRVAVIARPQQRRGVRAQRVGGGAAHAAPRAQGRRVAGVRWIAVTPTQRARCERVSGLWPGSGRHCCCRRRCPCRTIGRGGKRYKHVCGGRGAAVCLRVATAAVPVHPCVLSSSVSTATVTNHAQSHCCAIAYGATRGAHARPPPAFGDPR